MAEFRNRRSCRVAVRIPIRVFGIDYRGMVFSEDAFAIVVSLHGAKVRMAHQLLPEAEVRLWSQSTGRDAVFRVVSKVESTDVDFTYWGMENLNPVENIWGVNIPEIEPEDQHTVRVTLECPVCSARESLRADEPLLAALQEKGGLERTCKTCNSPGLWQLPSLPPM